jgi:PRTRC genetic system protein B
MKKIGFEGASSMDPPRVNTYRLTSALLFYSDTSSQLAMLHKASDSGVLGPGKPVDPVEFAKTIYRLKAGEMVERLVLVGENVLAENRDAILWWRPASVAPIWFKTAEPVPKLTALNGVPIHHPPLVFKASKRAQFLSVWALKANRRPASDTPLYHAPYMNMFGQRSGGVCLGNAKLNAATATPADWEKLFFDSNFSHTPPRLNHVKEAKDPNDPNAKRKALEGYASFLETLRVRPGQSEDAEGIFDHSLLGAGCKLSAVL